MVTSSTDEGQKGHKYVCSSLRRKGGGFMRNRAIDAIILTLVIIGAINWGLIGFFGFNLVSAVFGSMTWVSRIIYALVGLGGLYLISFYGNLGEEEA